jgi:hypothetical protein
MRIDVTGGRHAVRRKVVIDAFGRRIVGFYGDVPSESCDNVESHQAVDMTHQDGSPVDALEGGRCSHLVLGGLDVPMRMSLYMAMLEIWE